MDNFVQITKPADRNRADPEKKQKNPARYHPYLKEYRTKEKKEEHSSDHTEEKALLPLHTRPCYNIPQPSTSSRVVTKNLLATLKSQSNPLTHPAGLHRAEHISSSVNGHQRGERGHGHSTYFSDMKIKLKEQEKERGKETKDIFFGLRIYANSYSEDTTRSEIARLVGLHGGTSSRFTSGATHVITSRPLSGSKTHKHLTEHARNKVHVVKPEWVFDSIKAGKRLKEWDYTLVTNQTQGDLSVLFEKMSGKD